MEGFSGEFPRKPIVPIEVSRMVKITNPGSKPQTEIEPDMFDESRDWKPAPMMDTMDKLGVPNGISKYRYIHT